MDYPDFQAKQGQDLLFEAHSIDPVKKSHL